MITVTIFPTDRKANVFSGWSSAILDRCSFRSRIS